MHVRCLAFAVSFWHMHLGLRWVLEGWKYFMEQTWSLSHCGTNFKLLTLWNKHEVSHSLEQTWSLSHCGTNMKFLTIWNKPEVSHIVERTLSCSHCGTNMKFLTIWNKPEVSHIVEQPKVSHVVEKFLTLWNKPEVSHIVEQTWSLSHCGTNLNFLTGTNLSFSNLWSRPMWCQSKVDDPEV